MTNDAHNSLRAGVAILFLLKRGKIRGESILENAVQSKAHPVLARSIEVTAEALVVITESRAVSIPWARCSSRLAQASPMERSRAELSPSGYGIHWPLIDEDLAVGPLVENAPYGASGN
ncbi:MAG: DUF2442 domain-containing protein [Bryobacteraceae bacterium]|nr:DUF2442 domain-containing protein [Bryobacteraceae bacterium]